MESTSIGRPRRGYETFEGEVDVLASNSIPSWRYPETPPGGAPNVIVVLVDDLGFSDLAPFGSEVDTPAITAIASEGYVLSNAHSTPLCSPSRAALLTGINPHRAGFASVSRADPGFPGYRMELPHDAPTVAESFREAGYGTMMVGKWHLSREADKSDGGSRRSWPLQRGFDRYFGCLDAFTTMFHPHRLMRDNSPVLTSYSPDTYLTDLLTDEAIEMIAGHRASAPDRPFFLYFAHQAVHGPLQSKRADIEKYRGAYDEGWRRIRQRRIDRQVQLGLFSPETELAGPDESVMGGAQEWDELTTDERERYSRYMEVYAAAVDAVDQSVSRLVEFLKKAGEYENTIIVITSDNGATGEGGLEGTRSYFSQFVGAAKLPEGWVRDVDRDIALIGGPQAYVHYPKAWANVSNAPFRGYKSGCYEGGVHVPLVVSWPAGLPRAKDDDGVRDGFTYVTDIAPTLLDLAGVSPLATRQGETAKELDGMSLRPVLSGRSRSAAARLEQHFECGGNRAMFDGRYKAVSAVVRGGTISDDNWELFDLASDPTELNDLALSKAGRLEAMRRKWYDSAWWNTVFPLDDDGSLRRRRTDAESVLSLPVDIYPETPPLERYRSNRLTQYRSFVIEIRFDQGVGDAEGVLVAHGDQGGGYVVFIENGQVCLSYNGFGAMTRSRIECSMDTDRIDVVFTALADLRWRIDIHVGGEATQNVGIVPQLFGMAPFTGISVGTEFSSPVDWELHVEKGLFPFSGQLHKVRYIPGESAPYSTDIIAEIAKATAIHDD